MKRRAALSGLLAGACSHVAYYRSPVRDAPADWNPERIQWHPYPRGMRLARRTGTPIVLVFYTDWCPHCHNYKKVFHDPELAEEAQSFVMIRVERDSSPELSRRYDIDGEYIPRTFFLKPNGEVLTDLDSGRSEYRYFLDEYDPTELLELMRRARSEVGR